MSGDINQVWRTIQLGRHSDTAAYRKALQDGGFRMSELARDLLWRIPLAKARIPTKVNIYRVIGRQLGLTTRYTTLQFSVAAVSHGFTNLPAESGLALRLDYDDQPKGEITHIGMEPIAASAGRCVFDVARGDDDLWLDATCVFPTSQWSPGYIWALGRSEH